jgi:hypothetical protein
MLNIKVRSQNELEVVWSNDNKNGGVTNFQICWNKAAGGTNEECCDDDIAFPEPKKSRRISGLEKATKYIITVARYNSDGKTPGRKRQEIAITRSGQNLLIIFINKFQSLLIKNLLTPADIIVNRLTCSYQNEKIVSFLFYMW